MMQLHDGDNDKLTSEEMEHSANVAFLIWTSERLFKAFAVPDFVNDDDKLVAFIICFCGECGYDLDSKSINICWDMEKEIADKLLNFVTPSLKDSFDKRYGPLEGNWR
jgi:hypothetical protein